MCFFSTAPDYLRPGRVYYYIYCSHEVVLFLFFQKENVYLIQARGGGGGGGGEGSKCSFIAAAVYLSSWVAYIIYK